MTNRFDPDEPPTKGLSAATIDLRWDPEKKKLTLVMDGPPTYGVALAMLLDCAKDFKESYESRTGTEITVSSLESKLFQRSYEKKPDDWDQTT